jgi:hypothetical protein
LRRLFFFEDSIVVKTIAQAQKIQIRRRNYGYSGIAQAVKRFLKRTGTPVEHILAVKL